MTSTKIYKIIKDNEDTIAFIVGNGINLYCKPDNSISWADLMNQLWIEYANGSSSNFPRNIPYTELYDIIELQYYKKCMKQMKKEEQICLTKLVAASEQIPNLTESFAFRHNYSGRIDKIPIPVLYQSENIEKARKDVENNAIKIFKEFGFPKESLSFDDFPLAIDLTGRESGIRLWIKHVISKKFQNASLNDQSLPFLTYAKRIKAPILTTNYDSAMANKLGLAKFQLPFDTENQHLYPTSTYFGERELEKSIDGFGIWHINGIAEFQNSIKLGLCDYMDLVYYVTNLLQKDDQLSLTWVDILFKKPLFIFGLGLNEDEIPLRWLLLQRYKYSLYYNRPLKGWYVAPKKDLKENKRQFLKSVGIEIISINDYKMIYEDIWQLLK